MKRSVFEAQLWACPAHAVVAHQWLVNLVPICLRFHFHVNALSRSRREQQHMFPVLPRTSQPAQDEEQILYKL